MNTEVIQYFSLFLATLTLVLLLTIKQGIILLYPRQKASFFFRIIARFLDSPHLINFVNYHFHPSIHPSYQNMTTYFSAKILFFYYYFMLGQVKTISGPGRALLLGHTWGAERCGWDRRGGRAQRLGQASGRALRPHDQLYLCVTLEIHVQN